MSPDLLKRIFEEGVSDYSAEICPKAKFSDLDADAIKKFRAMWRRKSGNEALDRLGDEQLLRDAGLIRDDGITYAALILLGTREGLNRLLAQAEIIFEYRADEASIPYQQRKEYRQGFLPLHDELWALINLRNEVHQFQEGFFVGDIPTFNEAVVREAILNAICHRDYRLAGSIFIRQFPHKLEIVSPGGFPPGITPENILWKQFPRNRLMAEAFARCGLVERSGQGANRMFEQCIKEGKRQPDFSGTDDYQVSLTLPGEVQDPNFLRFLEEIGKETQAPFNTEDLLVLDLIFREQPVPPRLKPHLLHLRDAGAIETRGRGKGTRYLLARRYYRFIGKEGAYTRRKGLDRETNKALLLKLIQEKQREGCRLSDLAQVLPELSTSQLKGLVQELKSEKKIHPQGRTKAGRWYPGSAQGSATSPAIGNRENSQ
jgi:ATP-dependent DNA helicase RecG